MQHGGPGNYSITYDMSSKDFNIVDMSVADWKVFGPTFSTYEDAENACAKIIRPMLEADKKSFENILFWGGTRNDDLIGYLRCPMFGAYMEAKIDDGGFSVK